MSELETETEKRKVPQSYITAAASNFKHLKGPRFDSCHGAL